jgi:hypothetical protein
MCQRILKLGLLKAKLECKAGKWSLLCWAGDFVRAWWSIQQRMHQPILYFQPINFGTPNSNITQMPQAPKNNSISPTGATSCIVIEH